MTFFVKYPPKGDTYFRRPTVEALHFDDGAYQSAEWEPCTYGTEPEYHAAASEIRNCRSTFDETGNPLYVFEALRQATAAKLYPPLWVIEYLDERLLHACSKNISLDTAFGFSAKGLGKGKQTSPKERDKLRARNRLLCLVVFKLQGAGLSRPAACHALSSLLYRLSKGKKLSFGGNENELLFHMDISGKGIEKAVLESEETWSGERETTADAAKSWNESEKVKLLSVFYPSELPVTR